MNKTHELKILPQYYAAVADGTKTFEIRKNDRDYQTGDIVTLKEYNEDTKEYTGNESSFKIGFVTDYEQTDDYVVFSIQPLKQKIYVVAKSVVDIFDGDHEEYTVGTFATEQEAEEFVQALKEEVVDTPTFYSVSCFELGTTEMWGYTTKEKGVGIMHNVFIVQKDTVDIFDKIRDTYIIGVFSKEELAREFIKNLREEYGEIATYYLIKFAVDNKIVNEGETIESFCL